MSLKIKEYFQERLQERSTWTGIIQLIPVITGYTIAPEYIESFITLGLLLGAGHKIITKG